MAKMKVPARQKRFMGDLEERHKFDPDVEIPMQKKSKLLVVSGASDRKVVRRAG
jgi:hypothetical protein